MKKSLGFRNAPAVVALLLLGLATAVVHAAEATLGADNARHLLNRTGFAATEADIAEFAKRGRAEAAEQLVKAVRFTATQSPHSASVPA